MYHKFLNKTQVTCLEAATNNHASTAFAAFKRTTEIHGMPFKVNILC